MSKPLSFLIIFSFLFLSVKGANVQQITSLGQLSSAQLTEKGEKCVMELKRDSAIIYLTLVADRIVDKNMSQLDHRFAVKAMGNLGALYSFHDFEKSYFYLKKALTLAEEFNYTEYLPPLYANMGCISHSLNNMSGYEGLDAETHRYFHKAFYLSIRQKNYNTLFSSFNNIANIALGVGVPNAISDILSSMDSIGLVNDSKIAYITSLHKEAILKYLNNNPIDAIETFRKIEANCQDDPEFRLLALSSIANIYSLSKDFKKSIEVSKKALELARSLENKEGELSVLKDLKKHSDSIGDKESSDRYYLDFLKLQDSIYIVNNLTKIPKLQIEDEIREANWVIQSLNYKNRVQRTIVVGFSLLTLIAIMFLLTVYAKNKKLKKRNAALYAHNEKILKERDDKLKIISSYEAKLSQVEEVTKSEEPTDDTPLKKYRNSNLSDDILDSIVTKIRIVMQNAAEICNDSFSLDRLSELTGWKKNYLSQALNERLNQNFNSLLAENRVMIVCKKIREDQVFINLSIEAIAESAGFKSRSNFSAVFKKITGLSPSEYIKITKSQR